MRIYLFSLSIFFICALDALAQKDSTGNKPQYVHPKWNVSLLLNVNPGVEFNHGQVFLGGSFRSHQLLIGSSGVGKKAPKGEERYSRTTYSLHTNPMYMIGYRWMPKIGRNAFFNLTYLLSYAEASSSTWSKVGSTTYEYSSGTVNYFTLSFSHYFDNLGLYYGFGVAGGGPFGDGFLNFGISMNLNAIEKKE